MEHIVQLPIALTGAQYAEFERLSAVAEAARIGAPQELEAAQEQLREFIAGLGCASFLTDFDLRLKRAKDCWDEAQDAQRDHLRFSLRSGQPSLAVGSHELSHRLVKLLNTPELREAFKAEYNIA